ncbi:MAG: hypothetical protein CMK89_11955 [Pseudomonadales bacterium]|nr:hypothetical protein [Pseudomonadales bacterium]
MEKAQCTTAVTTAVVAMLVCNAALGSDDLFELPLEDLLQVKITSTSYFDQTLLESASSVSHGDQDRWSELGSRNIGEWLNTLPSTVAPQGLARSRVIAIRGYFNFSSDTGVATLLDGVPINLLRFGTSALAIDGHDLSVMKSLELIRGPGSSLHGADAFHGVLSMNTVDHGKTGVTTRAELGSEQYQAASLVSRYSDGRQQLTTALAYRNLGDQSLEYPYTDYYTGLPGEGVRSNALENQNLLIKYSAADASNNRYHLSGYHMKLDADQLPGIASQIGFALQLDRDWADYDAQLSLMKLGFDHQYSEDFSTTVTTYYWRYADMETLDASMGPAPLNFLQLTETEEHHWGVQVINRHQFSGGSNLAYGYEYDSAQNDRFTTTRIPLGGSAVTNSNPQEDAKQSHHSLMLDGRYETGWFDGASTIAYGSRFDDYQDKDLQVSPRLGYIHDINQTTVAKLVFSRSFRMPNSFEVYGSSSVASNEDLDPETLDNIEFSLQHNNAYSFTSLTLFHSLWRNAIRAEELENPVNNVRYQFRNTLENEAWGVEFEFAQRWERLRLDASASHVISRDKATGLDFEAFPDWMLNLGLGYQLSASTDIYVFNRYHHRQAASIPEYGEEPDQETSDFFRTDVTLSWQLSADLKTHFTVRNLFDRENYMPAYHNREKGAPDNSINASLSVEWIPFDH